MNLKKQPSKKTATGKKDKTLCSSEELWSLLDERNEHNDNPQKYDRMILEKFQVTRAILVLDMARFSISVQRYGIIHHLALIRKMHRISTAAIRRHEGTIVKFFADNCMAVFDSVVPALEASIEINHEISASNLNTPDQYDIFASIGIGYGSILLPQGDLFGDEVNLASKLGEDLAEEEEILLTDKARKQIRSKKYAFENLKLNISGIRLPAHRLKYKS